MASTFSCAQDSWICQGDSCEATADLTYYVQKKKNLCQVCAFKEGCIGNYRKDGANLKCEKHDKIIELYCRTHCVALCYLCAIIDHQHHPCVRQDIEGALLENKTILQSLKERANEKLDLCRVHGDTLRQCRAEVHAHLKAIRNEVDSVIGDVIKKDLMREQEDATKINQEIDEEIQKKNEERRNRLELNRANAEYRRAPAETNKRNLHADIQSIVEETERKVAGFEEAWQGQSKVIEDAVKTLVTVLKDDSKVVKDGHRVNTSVTDELEKPLDAEGVERITWTVSGVKFVKGAEREKYNGRIDGYDGEWRLIDTISVKDQITYPTILGCIDESKVIIRDRLATSKHVTHILHINSKRIENAMTGRPKSWVVSCALLKDDMVVCGKALRGCAGNILSECISVYDRHWKLINDVSIPRNTVRDDTWVYVAADQDGMIIAAEMGQSKIYVINPTDGKIIHIITCNEDIKIHGVLSSGDIIARPIPADHRVFIIDREGAQKEIIHTDVIRNIGIDPMTDDLYVVSSDDARTTCLLDQMMSGGELKRKTVASFRLSTRMKDGDSDKYPLLSSPMMMTSSGKIIACDVDNILVYKKMFAL